MDADTTHDSDVAPNGWPWAMLRGFRAGERAALRDVYRLHAEEVARSLRLGFTFTARGQGHRFAGYQSAFDMHDALHETFRRAFEPRARERYDGIRPFGPYLKAIARNVVLRTFRAREVLFPTVGEPSGEDGSPSVRVTSADDEGNQEVEVARAQIKKLVAQFLTTLSEDERRFCEVRFIEGLSQRDTAEQLGLGRQQIRGRETKLRKKLVAYLSDRGEEGLLPAALCLQLAGLIKLGMGVVP